MADIRLGGGNSPNAENKRRCHVETTDYSFLESRRWIHWPTPAVWLTAQSMAVFCAFLAFPWDRQRDVSAGAAVFAALLAWAVVVACRRRPGPVWPRLWALSLALLASAEAIEKLNIHWFPDWLTLLVAWWAVWAARRNSWAWLFAWSATAVACVQEFPPLDHGLAALLFQPAPRLACLAAVLALAPRLLRIKPDSAWLNRIVPCGLAYAAFAVVPASLAVSWIKL